MSVAASLSSSSASMLLLLLLSGASPALFRPDLYCEKGRFDVFHDEFSDREKNNEVPCDNYACYHFKCVVDGFLVEGAGCRVDYEKACKGGPSIGDGSGVFKIARPGFVVVACNTKSRCSTQAWENFYTADSARLDKILYKGIKKEDLKTPQYYCSSASTCFPASQFNEKPELSLDEDLIPCEGPCVTFFCVNDGGKINFGTGCLNSGLLEKGCKQLSPETKKNMTLFTPVVNEEITYKTCTINCDGIGELWPRVVDEDFKKKFVANLNMSYDKSCEFGDADDLTVDADDDVVDPSSPVDVASRENSTVVENVTALSAKPSNGIFVQSGVIKLVLMLGLIFAQIL